MDDRGIQAPDRDRLPAKDLVPGVEEKHDEVLAGLLAKARPEGSDDIVWAADFLWLLAAVLPLGQFADIHVLLRLRGGIEERAPAVKARSPGWKWKERYERAMGTGA